MPVRPPMGAHVEIVEQKATETDYPVIVPRAVRINGTDVGLIKRDSLIIDPGNGEAEPASVTLTLYVKSVSIHAE